MSEDTERTAMPPQMALYQLAIGHYASRALHLAAKLGVADRLADGPRTADELAAATETHTRSLPRVLRFLASLRVLEEREDGRFALTPLGDALRTDVPGSARAMVMLFSGIGIQDSWKELEWCVRTGEPAYRKRGATDPFAEMAQDPDAAANFDQAMAAFTRMTAIAVAAVYDFTPFRTVLDVGGGNGALVLGILGAHSHLRGIVVDQPHVVERAKTEIAASGLGDRCTAVACDILGEVPGGADLYLAKHVIHDWDDERARAILANCRRAMPSDGKLLVIEGVYPARIDGSLDSRGAAANDVNMLVSTGGRQRSEDEFRALYTAAGFRLTRILPTPARVSLIEGVRD